MYIANIIAKDADKSIAPPSEMTNSILIKPIAVFLKTTPLAGVDFSWSDEHDLHRYHDDR